SCAAVAGGQSASESAAWWRSSSLMASKARQSVLGGFLGLSLNLVVLLLFMRLRPSCMSLRPNETLGLALAQLLGFLLKEKRPELLGLEPHARVSAHLGRALLQPFQRLRRKRDEAPFSPTGIRRPATA